MSTSMCAKTNINIHCKKTVKISSSDSVTECNKLIINIYQLRGIWIKILLKKNGSYIQKTIPGFKWAVIYKEALNS